MSEPPRPAGPIRRVEPSRPVRVMVPDALTGAGRRGIAGVAFGRGRRGEEGERGELHAWIRLSGGGWLAVVTVWPTVDRVHRVEVPLTLPAHCVRPSPEQPLGVAGVHREPTRCPRGHSWILDGQSCTSHWITGFDARDRGIDPHHSWACQLCGAEWHAPAGWGGDLGELRADVAGNPS